MELGRDMVDVTEEHRGREAVTRDLRCLGQHPGRTQRTGADDRRAERVGLLGEFEGARVDRVLQPRPAREAVLTRDGELRCRECELHRDGLDASLGVVVAASGRAQQILRLMAKLDEVQVRGEYRHDVSLRACGPRARPEENVTVAAWCS